MSVVASTHQQYTACHNRYIQWCHALNLQAFPGYQQNLILFVSDLALKSSFNNVKVYLPAVKLPTGMHHFRITISFFSQWVESSQHMGINSRNPNIHPPITANILKEIKLNLFNSLYLFEDQLMIWGAMMLAFLVSWGYRSTQTKGPKAFDPEFTLCFNDITINRLIHVKIKSSKTDPVVALKQFIAIHPTKSGPLFTFQIRRYQKWQA